MRTMDAADRLRLASKLDKRETLAFAHKHTTAAGPNIDGRQGEIGADRLPRERDHLTRDRNQFSQYLDKTPSRVGLPIGEPPC